MTLSAQEEYLKLKRQLQRQRELPHLFGQKFYFWQRKFWDSLNRQNFLTAANQIGKSSINIKKAIHWATAPHLWKELWPTKIIDPEYDKPRQFWYLYPDSKVATAEFHEKWVAEFLPRGSMKDHPVFGWRAEFEKKQIVKIVFNTGVTIYFKTYSQNPQSLQSGTVYAMFCFTAGHLITTDKGQVPIELIKVGDMVLTRDGYRRVQNTMSDIKPVIKRKFANGEVIEGTGEHPFLVNGGEWREFANLQNDDTCYMLPGWKLIRKLYYLRSVFTSVIRKMRIIAGKIIIERMTAKYSTFPYGRHTIKGQFLRIVSSIMLILIRLIIALKTFNVLLERSILKYIKKRSGVRLKPTHLYVPFAVQILFQKVLRKLSPATVHKDAGKRHTEKDLKRVYNITVEGKPEYFVNGILVHNCDEELPIHLYDELKQRLSNTLGYFHMVFTATLNQEEWRRAMEEQGTDDELFPDAFKQQISKFDCMYFEDGTPSAWTKERIETEIRECSSETEVQRRIYGKFVSEEGLVYSGYDKKLNRMEARDIPIDWYVFTGLDYGSGGKKGHPSAFIYLAVNPDFTQGEVFRGRRLDGVQTTAGDLLDRYIRDRAEAQLDGRINVQSYDYHCRDLKTLADRLPDEPLVPANKSRDEGKEILNTLFKFVALRIHKDADGELDKLDRELCSLREETDKRKAKDDFIDALRYTVMAVPWNMHKIKSVKPTEMPRPLTDEDRRRGIVDNRNVLEDALIDEINMWNDLLEP